MISVSVKYAGLPRTEAGKPEEKWPVREGDTLEDLLAAVGAKYGWPLDDASRLIVVYNDHGLPRGRWSGQRLKEKDRILILSSIAGG